MAQKGKPKAALAPWAANSQCAHPASICIVMGMRAAKVKTGNFPGGAIHRKEVQSWIVACILTIVLPAFQTFFKRLIDVTKMIAESLFVGAMSSFRVSLRVIGAQGNAFWKFWLRHRRLHFDEHVIPTADVLVA